MTEWANEFHNMKYRIDDVLAILETNQSNHRLQFIAAVDAYRKLAIGKMEERIQQIRYGGNFDLGFGLPVPEDHTDDYQRVIKMLELTLRAGESYVILGEQQVAQYVMDDWHWSTLVTSTNEFYSVQS